MKCVVFQRDKYVYKDFVIVAHYQIVNEETVQVDEKASISHLLISQ